MMAGFIDKARHFFTFRDNEIGVIWWVLCGICCEKLGFEVLKAAYVATMGAVEDGAGDWLWGY